MTDHFDITSWHRRLCPVTDRIVVSGDLHEDPERATSQLELWTQSGITHVLDTRSEWSDKKLVEEHAPDLVYGWFGTDDDGSRQPDGWFDDGLGFAAETLRVPESVYWCTATWVSTVALRWPTGSSWNAGGIRSRHSKPSADARPIADIGYAGDALDHYHRSHSVSASQRVLDRDRLEAWRRGYPTTGLHLMRPDA